MKMFRSDQRKDYRREWTEEELEELTARRRVSPGKISGTSSLVWLPSDAPSRQDSAGAQGPTTTTPLARRRWAGEALDESALFGMTRPDHADGPMLGRGADAMTHLAWRPEAISLRSDAHAGAPVQRKSVEEMPASEIQIETTGSGEPLPEDVRAKMEAALGMDFSAVRIHVGHQAASMGALAFTRGTDIFFAPGQYQPWSRRGQELLGHELTHVVQQADGRVGISRDMGGVGVNDDAGLEREADELGARASARPHIALGATLYRSSSVRSSSASPAGAGASHTANTAPVQRQEDPDGNSATSGAGSDADSPPALSFEIGPFKLELRTWQDLNDFFDLLATQVRSAMKGAPADSPILERAREWLEEVEGWKRFRAGKPNEPIGDVGKTWARTRHQEAVQFITKLNDAKVRAEGQKVARELRRAREHINEERKKLAALKPKLDEQLRRSFLSGDTDTIAQVAGMVSSILDMTLSLETLSRDMASVITKALGGKVPSPGAVRGWLGKFNKIMAGANLFLNYQSSSKAPTQVAAAMTELNNLTLAFGTVSTLGDLAPHIGLYTNLYLAPMVSVITQQLGTILTKWGHDLNTLDMATGNAPKVWSIEPGGKPMFNFMVQLMHASDPDAVPDVPKAVETYIMDHRDAFNAGTKSNVPTTGWVFKDLDKKKSKEWLFYRRERLWALLYGSWDVPDEKLRAR